jgi:hypothetical protein
MIESFAGSGIRVAVSEPDYVTGDFDGSSSPPPADWRELISHVDPTQSHHLEMRLTYVDGPNNDKIDVFLDGTLIGSTTTFENYHDLDPDNIYSYLSHAAAAQDYQTDRVIFRGSANGAPQDGPGGAKDAGFDIDNVSTAVYNDVNGTGTETANVITGNSGNNTLTGLGGNDTLNGGAGNDTLIGGAGSDTIDGGAGFDTASFSGSHGNYTVVFDGVTATVTDTRGGSPDGQDTITGVGRLHFTDHDVLLVGAGSDYKTIQSAIDAASAGDTIIVAAGVYKENVNFNKSVTVLGPEHGVSGTGAGRGAANGTGEATIVGHSDITAPGAVTIDGFRFLNDATTTGGGPGDPTLQIQNGNDHVVTNSIFYSTVTGGTADDRAIALPPIASGHVTISNNDFTGSQPGLFGTASWGREIWSDGGGVDLSVTGNTFEFGRTAINLDMSGDSDVTVQGNTFHSDGTGIAVGVDSDNLHVTDNNVQNVGDDFNFRNLTTATTFDADTAIQTLTPASPANPGNDAVVILGGSGNDTFYGTDGVDYIDGNNSPAFPSATDSDTLHGRGGNDFLFGRGGNDTLDGGAGNDALDGGAGIDTANGYGNAATIVDSAGTWTVHDGSDVDTLTSVEKVVINGHNTWLVGGGGFATIQAAIDAAGTGDTVLVANGTYAGNVTLKSGITLVGESEAGVLWGEGGNDQINGGIGDDSVSGGDGDDMLGGGDGSDIVVGDAGNDTLFGEGGDDHMNGGVGNDILIGGDGNDELGGGTGNDTLVGGTGNDTLFGEDGDDLLNGGTGNDILLGMTGADTFSFTAGDGSDIIADFTAGTDHIWFSATSLHNFADVQSHATFSSVTGATTISYTGGTVVLNGVALNQLHASDFIFS